MQEGGHKVARRNIGDFCDITKGFLAKVFMLQTFWKLELKTTTTKMLLLFLKGMHTRHGQTMAFKHFYLAHQT